MDSDQGKVFVGGISWETTEENLKDYFQRYGEVLEAVIMKDRNTGRARGFGFVSFADPAAADIALLDKHTINGRIVEAKKAVPRDEQQNMPKSSIGSGGQSPGGQGRTKKIFVGGLASTITEEEFRRYFEQFGTISDAVVMYDHTTQRPRGFGFITFDSEESVDNVLLKNFHELNDKLVEVKRAVPKDQSPMNMRAPASGFPGPAGAGRGGYAYGQGYPSMGLYGPDARYGTIPAGRGSYPYPAGGYPPGYGSAGYGMNGSYPAGYAGSAGYGYGGAPGAAGYASGGTGSPGYGNTPGRSSWPSAAAYGGTTPGYATGGYGTGMWGSAEQTAGQAAANNYAGYYGSDNGYGSNTGGYGVRGSGGYGGYGGSPGGYGSGGSGAGSGSYGASGGSYNTGYSGDGYGNSGYSDGTWRAGGGDSYSGGGSTAAANGGYNVGPATTDGATNGTTGYGGGYGAASRQSQRGPDARFRPYPTASDRS